MRFPVGTNLPNKTKLSDGSHAFLIRRVPAPATGHAPAKKTAARVFLDGANPIPIRVYALGDGTYALGVQRHG